MNETVNSAADPVAQDMMNRIKELERLMAFYSEPETRNTAMADHLYDQIKETYWALDMHNLNRQTERNASAVSPAAPEHDEPVTVIGTRRNDVFFGNLGRTAFYGGLGDDTYHVRHSNDLIVENGGEGTDTVYSSVTYTAPANVENLTLTGNADIYGFGNNANNILTGNSGNNRLSAGRGNDTLYGMDGNDLLLAGDGNDYLYGGSGSDILRGGNGDDYLDGGDGYDNLEGGAGADIMRGGQGDDTYQVDHTGDTVIEEHNGGNDTVYSAITYTAPTHVENLTLTGSANIYGFGNNANNILTGNSGNNRLSAGRGNDTLYGMDGNDLLLAGDGHDYLYGGSGSDILRGGNGDDTLGGGEGSDKLEGGAGNDVYLFSYGSGNDVIEDGEGRNTVRLSGGLRPEELAVRIVADPADPARSNWVLTIAQTGETLTVKAQEGGAKPAVSAFVFDSAHLTPAQLLSRAQVDLDGNALTTRILYHNGRTATLASDAAAPFQTASLQYWQEAPAERSNRIVRPTPEQAARSGYAKDSDGDGLVDVIDRNPDRWNVSERDLRMFASLAYENEGRLKTLFNGHNWWEYAGAANAVNQQHFLGQADVSELTGKWELLKAESPGSGLDYAVFGNRNEKGGYENIVVTFRGTEKTSPHDLYADLKILFGNTPTQTSYLNDIARYVDSFNPTNVYSTGHSLGGYLAQYFAAYTMQQKYSWQTDFHHSSLFNPAILKVDGGSDSSLKNARSTTEYFTRSSIIDESDTTQNKYINKTNSYVITGEWVSSGFSFPFKGLFSGLGTYGNSVMFDFKQNKLWGKHDMTSFYENNAKLQQYFSQGARIDKHYANPYLKDSDYDGFSDGIESKTGSNPFSASATPYATGTAVYADTPPVMAIVQTEDASGNVISVKGVEMAAAQRGSQLVYTPTGKETDLGTSGFDWSAFENTTPEHGTALLQGTAGRDILKGGNGSDYLLGGLGSDTLIGGGGRDTFAFTASDIREGRADRLPDFNPAEDMLDLSAMRPLLSGGDSLLKWSDLLVNDAVLFDNSRAALHFNTAEQTLAYRAAGSDTATVFARFDSEAAAALNGANLIG